MVNTLPHAYVKVYNDHAYVKLYSVIEHLVSHGLEFDDLHNNTSDVSSISSTLTISNTPEAQARLAKINDYDDGGMSTLVLHVALWSDDFEVTHIKCTKSIWVHTVTVCPPTGHMASSRYTHALALGHKCRDHDKILEQ